MVSDQPWPDTVSMPPGTGKTAIMKIWLIALAWNLRSGKPRIIPSRLIWVVNRRVVDDQTTYEAEEIRAWIAANPRDEFVRALGDTSLLGKSPLAISTLRGEVVDCKRWGRDPLTPAIVVGTVDMIGSRLLFRGYGDDRNVRSKLAGLLGVDSLIVNDDAHLTPAFAKLLKTVESMEPAKRFRQYGKQFRVLLLSASDGEKGERPFLHDLTTDLNASEHFRNVYHAEKRLWIREAPTDSAVTNLLVSIALETPAPRTIIFVEKPEKAAEVARLIEKKTGVSVALLVGTMRGYERQRDQVDGPVFALFKQRKRPAGRSYLVTTSAGEVGVDMTAELLLTTLVDSDRLLQRFSRLNRYGDQDGDCHTVGNAYVVAVPPKSSDADQPKRETLQFLKSLEKHGDGSYNISIAALAKSHSSQKSRSKAPIIPRLEPWQIDLWSQTSSPSRLYSRGYGLTSAMPRLASWLHGKQESDLPETSLAWRAEVRFLVRLDHEDRKRALEGYPVLPHEKITESTPQLLAKLEELASRIPKTRVIFLDRDGRAIASTVTKLTSWSQEDLSHGLLLLPAGVGKLRNGMWQPEGASADDVANETEQFRRRYLLKQGPSGSRWTSIESDEEVDEPPQPLLRIELPVNTDEDHRYWLVFQVLTKGLVREEIDLSKHLQDAGRTAATVVSKSLSDLGETYRAAGEAHDTGKRNRLWQWAVGGTTDRPLAFNWKKRDPASLKGFRHELASVLDLSPEKKKDDLLVHLIASHHGCARPYWESKAFDPQRMTESKDAASEALQRFSRLQKEWGPWGLAYLEALFTSADWLSEEYSDDRT